MIDQWLESDLEKQIKNRKRVVLLDPANQFNYLIKGVEQKGYVLLSTDDSLQEDWQTVKEELFLRYEAEQKHKAEIVVFYVTRPQKDLSFLFDYCFTHGLIDLSNPAEWLRKKLFTHTGMQVSMENPLLLTAAKLSVGKDLAWWKRILQNLEDLVSIEDELLPFLDDPDNFFVGKTSDVKRLYEERMFELLGQPYMSKPPKTIASEIATLLFDKLLNNDIEQEWLLIYHKWLDSNTYSGSLQHYIDQYKVDKRINIWNVHPEHCFSGVDYAQLKQTTENFRDTSFVKDKLQKIKLRLKSHQVSRFVPSWWNDLITLFEFDNRPLVACNSFDKVIAFYTTAFHKVDRAMRNIYISFIQEESIVRPLQEHYESLNRELLQHWFDHASEYKSNQQGYLVSLIKGTKPGVAVIVGDGVRYEIAAHVSSQLMKKMQVQEGNMLADMPSETEHNMSALYVGGNKIIPLQKEREKGLSELTGKEITYINLEALHYGIKADYLVLTYKDIDSTGEKLQMGALKLFSELERVLVEKIQLLLNMNYREVYLITDHGFVLTGLLDEADKIDPNAIGKKEVHERYIRTVDKQTQTNWLMFEEHYEEYNYVYAAQNHRPFKSKGVYGFSHGGFTPQEIIIPALVFKKEATTTQGLGVEIINKNELNDVTGDLFGVKIQAASKVDDLFSANRKIQILLYANNVSFSSTSIISIDAGASNSFEFSFGGNNEVTAVLVDANTQEQLDTVKIKKSNARDLAGLL
ncbi:MAG: hypothetical protein EOO20_08235 [Chryseobacterium sp.]|nr:MAG: hypothetical protein EOO20_08235 [Chryseobacterium sp.]